MPIREALERGGKIYDIEHTHAADREVMLNHLGYSSKNGASMTVIGTLREYGILEDSGNGLRISDDAVTIYELPKTDPEHIAALGRMAFKPPFYSPLSALGSKAKSSYRFHHDALK